MGVRQCPALACHFSILIKDSMGTRQMWIKIIGGHLLAVLPWDVYFADDVVTLTKCMVEGPG